MSQFDYANMTAIRVGSEIVGWVGPKTAKVGSAYKATVTAVMGSETVNINASELKWAYMELSKFDRDALDAVMQMVEYSRKFVIPIPEGSVTILQSGGIGYTQRFVENMMAALHKFCSALANNIQADLHTKTPIEAVRKWVELAVCNYPGQQLRELTWRGQTLDKLVEDSEMLVRALKDGMVPGTDPYLHVGLGELREFRNSTPFTSFVEWQVRSRYGYYRKQPTNVFLIRASTPEEHTIGMTIFQSATLLKKFLTAIGREDIPDSTFFLSVAGDPLEKWVDGQTVSVREISELVSS